MFTVITQPTLRIFVILALLTVACSGVFAKKVLADLDFSEGEWAIIGVPLHNYKLLPIQEDLGTFIMKDKGFMQQIQQDWDLNLSYDEKCDHHYALKVYRNHQLVRTFKLNLHCRYLSYDGFAYRFDPQEFSKFRTYAQKVPWSRISFDDASVLRKAIGTLDQSEQVYWYNEIYQYQYPGFFMLSITDLPWNTNRDSLYHVVGANIVEKAGSRQFYLEEYFHITEGEQMDIRYIVNCEESLAQKLGKYQYLPWRSHLKNEEGVIYIVAIGINEEGFRKLMRN